VQIPVPEGTTAKQVEVVMKPSHLMVKLKGADSPIVNGDLAEKIKVADSFWTVENKKFISISFEKAYEAIWKTVIVGDKEIDPKTVDNSKRVEEFDLETQGHL
jgi:regulatory protein YycH of two-component signal transduction system YycFG